MLNLKITIILFIFLFRAFTNPTNFQQINKENELLSSEDIYIKNILTNEKQNKWDVNKYNHKLKQNQLYFNDNGIFLSPENGNFFNQPKKFFFKNNAQNNLYEISPNILEYAQKYDDFEKHLIRNDNEIDDYIQPDIAKDNSIICMNNLKNNVISSSKKIPWNYAQNEKQKKNLDEKLMDNNLNSKRTVVAFKRQKLKSLQTEFVPSISVGELHGSMNNLGGFFHNLKNNVDFMENRYLDNDEKSLLDGNDHPIATLRVENEDDTRKPSRTAAFLHAIRTYKPSNRVRALVAMTPDGYHGTHSLDPNYMWLGLGK